MFNLAPVEVPDLTGKVVLVTGAGRGIGAALVRLLCARGARVFAGIYPGAAVEDLPPAATRLALDVTLQKDVDAALAAVAAGAGRLDVLVNNAGVIAPIGPLPAVSPESLGAAFEVNVMGLQRMVRAALPMLTAARGAILNAGTGAATTPMEGWTAYCTTKAAAQMLTRMMDKELTPLGLRSFFVGIPPTDTDMQGTIRASGLNPISQIPKQSLVPAEVPASCLAWLCGHFADLPADPLLDVRQELFTRMMRLAPGAGG
jgi:NAD(P)-dependent dehydrogenase (short-subunit alcohol dehydrogenase family)